MNKLIQILTTDEFKNELISLLNEHIDIPIINEATEAKVFDALIETILIITTKLSHRY